LRNNHYLVVTDTLPSLCASLTKAMVHCIWTCDTQLWHFVFATIFNITNWSTANYQEIF